MAKPLIGIPGYRSESGVFGVGSNYLEWISKFGVPRIIFPYEEKVHCNLLLLPGGPDLNSSSYGEIPGFKTGEPCPFRQHFFDKRLDNYIDNTPIFGICLGAQMLNVKLGGKLTQNLLNHPMSEDRGEEGHRVILTDAGDFIAGLKSSKKLNSFSVNSHHHQGIRIDQLGKGLDILAIYQSKVESIIESALHTSKPLAFVQWHPEEWYDDFSFKLVKYLLK